MICANGKRDSGTKFFLFLIVLAAVAVLVSQGCNSPPILDLILALRSHHLWDYSRNYISRILAFTKFPIVLTKPHFPLPVKNCYLPPIFSKLYDSNQFRVVRKIRIQLYQISYLFV